MTVRSKICKYLDYENKGHIVFSDFSVVFLYVMLGLVVLMLFNVIVTFGLLVSMTFFNYEPVLILGSIETFPLLYSLKSIIFGIFGFIFIEIPIFAMLYLICSKIVFPIFSRVGSIKLISCDLKDDLKGELNES